ncbi:hypothetical protein DXX93_04195 [Thalassotalea euphylliae]|uniref:Uncharacterized protein n=1 Tax=Thalassotalea euphylliae TaxID=1655234 RepID=A0A3E0TMP3_9GAMM|nr:hypothetical protein [Thalassotalea euphylliae]REL25839.1 hypothetical protein DXX93_04195 [Thalassotalea euphylliae]
MNIQLLKNKLCTKDKTQMAIAIVFASLMIAIALLTQGNEHSFFITMLLIAGYFICSQSVKVKQPSD